VTVTDLLEQNVPRVIVQHLAGHADPRTTRLSTDEGDTEHRGTELDMSRELQ
jgi:hypothetical protein